MHKLARQVRFSINPFLDEGEEGYNSYASKPCGRGLCLYFGLWVELKGNVDEGTGFVVNVVDIDRAVRKIVVPIFLEHIKKSFIKAEHISLLNLCGVLKEAWKVLCDKFASEELCKLGLELNPFRKLTIESEDCEMFLFSEKFEFAAMHTLWNDAFSKERNIEVFGKCANPAGHGHNYIIEVTVEKPIDENEFSITGFQKTVEDEFIAAVDHKNLNVDVAEFAEKNTTVENITALAWNRLKGGFHGAELSSVTVWETDKTYCTYCE